jgi:hypothetical protein
MNFLSIPSKLGGHGEAYPINGAEMLNNLANVGKWIANKTKS